MRKITFYFYYLGSEITKMFIVIGKNKGKNKDQNLFLLIFLKIKKN